MEDSTSNIELSEETQSILDRFAKLTNNSPSSIINEAVEYYVQDRMAYLADLNTAIASIDTGPTYSGDEVFSWMRTWGAEDEKPASELFDLPTKT